MERDLLSTSMFYMHCITVEQHVSAEITRSASDVVWRDIIVPVDPLQPYMRDGKRAS